MEKRSEYDGAVALAWTNFEDVRARRDIPPFDAILKFVYDSSFSDRSGTCWRLRWCRDRGLSCLFLYDQQGLALAGEVEYFN